MEYSVQDKNGNPLDENDKVYLDGNTELIYKVHYGFGEIYTVNLLSGDEDIEIESVYGMRLEKII